MARRFLETVGLTDVGNVRQFNEDRIVVAPEIGVVVVADGMGGHRAGEVAAHLAADVVVSALRAHLAGPGTAGLQHSPLLALDKSINQANSAIYEAAQAHASRQGMGTTLAAALFHDDRVALGHIGDSRIYRMRGEYLRLMTRDDSLLRAEVDAGLISADEAAESHNRSLVTQALGVASRAEAHLREVDALPGDVFLLCTDGLSDLVEDADIELILRALRPNLPLAAQHLMQAAKDYGGYDNVSVVLVRVLRPFPARRHEGWLARLLGRRRRG